MKKRRGQNSVAVLGVAFAALALALVLWQNHDDPNVAAPRTDQAAVANGGGTTASATVVLAADSETIAAALATLDAIPAEGADEAPDYEREAFLPGGWADLDHDGCYTRNEILQRDLVDVTFLASDPECKVATGQLIDPYTGVTVNFDRAESTTTVQIDHLVPLAQAWRAGAWKWNKERRVAFANDPDEVLATAGAANQSKGDKGPAEWLPELNQCGYGAAYARLAGRYDLAIPAADRTALRALLESCA
ncbi:MAG: HNH endonuclease family protein [Bifidobacteriaceae bacterium]|nr:HNH endonuclease family protein [Bifidobacteriaceae bacterium]